MGKLKARVVNSLQSEEGRNAYTDTITNAFVAAQIKALREDRGFSQEQLAELIGTKQSGVSRLERADYSSWKIETLRKLARAFHVRLRIRFEGFGTLLDEIGGFDDKNLLPPKFEDDPAFKDDESKLEDVAAARRAVNANGAIDGQAQPSFQTNCDVDNQASDFTRRKLPQTQRGETRYRNRSLNKPKVPDAPRRRRPRINRSAGAPAAPAKKRAA